METTTANSIITSATAQEAADRFCKFVNDSIHRIWHNEGHGFTLPSHAVAKIYEKDGKEFSYIKWGEYEQFPGGARHFLHVELTKDKDGNYAVNTKSKAVLDFRYNDYTDFLDFDSVADNPYEAVALLAKLYVSKAAIKRDTILRSKRAFWQAYNTL